MKISDENTGKAMKRIYRPRLEKLFSYKTIMLIFVGVIINIVLPRIVMFLKLPLYLDNIGSVAVAVLGGVIPGLITAFTSNFMGYFGEPTAIMFGALTLTMAGLAAKISERGLLRRAKGFLLMWVMMVAIGGAIGSVMGWYLYGKTVGGTIAAPYVFWLCRHGMSGFAAQFVGDVFLDITDKGLTVIAVAAVLHFMPVKLRDELPLSYIYRCSDEKLEEEYNKDKKAFTGMSVFDKLVDIVAISMSISAVLITMYEACRFVNEIYVYDHDAYAMFEHITKLAGFQFVVIIMAIVLASWLIYRSLKQPIDHIVDQIGSFNRVGSEKWLESDEWRNRYVVNTKDEIQVLYQSVCKSELSICHKISSLHEDEKQMKQLAEIDRMTGIRNRGSGEQEIMYAIERGESGLLCLIDCDKFKNINDVYGNIAGDVVLVTLAEHFQDVCRDSDILLRLGGDEFAIYLKGVQKEEQALIFFRRLFKTLDSMSIPEIKGEHVYISLGAVFYDGTEGVKFDDLYRQADIALYRSKGTKGYSANIYNGGERI